MITRTEALAWLLPRLRTCPAEQVPLAEAAGRVLAAAVALAAAPPHDLAAIDGQAVCAADTEGASDYAPVALPGHPVAAGQPMPPGTDAVLPPRDFAAGQAMAPAARGSGVHPAGHHVPPGTCLAAGTRLRPLHLALLGALLGADPAVVRRPRVLLRTAAAKTRTDTLTPVLLALLAAEGATAVEAHPDLVLHAGGSGPGPDDEGARALTSLHAHGIAITPGETAAIGLVDGIPAILLPGSPAECATAFALLVAPVLRHMAGRPEPLPTPSVLTRKIVSALGLMEAVRVRLHEGQATPLGPGLAAAAGADGLVLVPEGSEGYPAGTTVPVHPLP